MPAILRILKPNVTSLGYALFLAINAAGVWGGVFPFLPLEFQTPEILFYFFSAQSLSFLATYFFSAIGSYFFPGGTRRFYVIAASIPYFFGWISLIAAIYVDSYALIFVTSGGALLGLGSAGLFMLWQRLFASEDSDSGNKDLIVGTAFSTLFYFSLYLIPRAVTVFLIPVIYLPAFGLCIVIKSRTLNFDQPMFEDIPRKHPHIYKQVISDYWRSALSFGTLGFCSGTMRALAVNDPTVGSVVNMLSMGGALVASLILLFLWQSQSIKFNVNKAYRFFFPFLMTAYLAIPFLGETFLNIYAGLLYAFYSCAIILMMIQCAQASRDNGINPVFIYGLFGTLVYFLHDLGFVSATLTESISLLSIIPINFTMPDISPLAFTSLISVYILGLMYFIGQGGFGQFRTKTRDKADDIELVALRPPVGAPNMLTRYDQTPLDNASITDFSKDLDTLSDAESGFVLNESQQYRDRISKQSTLMKSHYRLSAKEAKVMELLARGYSVRKIAEELVLSENTIRTHSKRIYIKLNIHKKQDLLDLVESFDPIDL